MDEISKSCSSKMGFALHQLQQPSDFVALDITSLSRKVSQKIGGDDVINGGVQDVVKSGGHVAGGKETVTSPSPMTPTAGKYMRRMGSRRVTSSRWLDPRRVLFVFATLSSMGTLILLYFTLSMGKMYGSDADAR